MDYLIPLDPHKRIRRRPEFGKEYTEKLLNDIKKQNGTIYIAEVGSITVGCVAGVIKKQSREELLENVPSKVGKILELFVKPEYRGKSIGQKLMKEIEGYFKSFNCDAVRVEVFAPNKIAHSFYQKQGYEDRDIFMFKKIQ